ncbi:TPA: hypothetical protein SK288_000878 [Yersinia enterocolitica]|nr:hypothetical protein [Yersinia enterocolitica]
MRHDCAPVSQAELPGTVATRRSASSQGAPTATTQACNARAALDGENAVVHSEKQQDRLPNPNEGTNRQAKRAGPQGPEVSGIKAEWP